MPGVIGSHQSDAIDLKKGESVTFLQLVSPQYGDATLRGVTLAPPNYGIPGGGPALANVTVTVERQRGGAFANNGLIPHRVSGGDVTQKLRARYRSVVREEPETAEVLRVVKAALYSGQEVAIDLSAPGASAAPALAGDPPAAPPADVKATPLAPIGIKVETDADVRIWYVVAQHEE